MAIFTGDCFWGFVRPTPVAESCNRSPPAAPATVDTSVVSRKTLGSVAPTFRSARAGLKASATSNAASSYFRDTTQGIVGFDPGIELLRPRQLPLLVQPLGLLKRVVAENRAKQDGEQKNQ
jgi:hypothetical protein